MGLRGHTAEAVLLNHTGFVELSEMCERERKNERERLWVYARVKAERTVGMSVCITPPVTFTHGGNEAVMAASMWTWLIFK